METEDKTNNFGNDIDQKGNLRPNFIREFSKETNRGLRDITAQEIREARKSQRAEKNERTKQAEIAEEKISELKAKIAEIENSFWSKLPIFNGRAKNIVTQDQIEIDRLAQEIESLKAEFISKDPSAILEDFYTKEKTRWQESGFDRQDVERYFGEEYLSSLDFDEYLLLLSRFNTEFATHVTRQGIRDHVGMMEHMAGQGEFWHGFEDILEDGRLKAAYSNIMMRENKEEALAGHFSWYVGQVKKLHGSDKSGRQILEGVLQERKNRGGLAAGSYSDRVAVHLGIKAVLDNYYGGETGNELFFLIPMAHIIKEYHICQAGPLSVDSNNNLWVWDQEHKGVSINAGIVCIPEEARVDPRNGSIYELDDENKPIINEENVETIARLSQSEDFIFFIENSTDEISQARREFHDSIIRSILTTLKDRFGITDSLLADLFINDTFGLPYRMINNYRYKPFIERTPREFAETDLSESGGCLYRRASNTISSKEYWDKYFIDRPERKPSKIYYYHGSPNGAVDSLRWRNKLDKYSLSQKPEYLFSEKRISGGEDIANTGYDDFFVLAERVLNKYFSE